uniref:Holocytochrome c-type synthase n=1 Tax=Peronospora matthiolae TaxID=2874970 RepID=A0AAV1UCP5_9STRA
MTADVNAAAAACPHPHKAPAKGCPAQSSKSKRSSDGSGSSDSADAGLNAEMMRLASHASGFTVHGSSTNVPVRLSQARAVSSIPKGENVTSEHQSDTNEDKWEYPSEAMYFKAMERKGWAPDAQQMKTIVAIHNTVNEQSWREVLKWESFHPSKESVKLKKFMGKPTEHSPKARMMNALGWSVLPFDRHDWIVDRDGKEVRYVIDFYSGKPEPGRPLSVYLDVRPALDSVEGLVDRVRWQFREKILPLLPFRGAAFGGEAAVKKPEGTTDEQSGRSKVTPKTD